MLTQSQVDRLKPGDKVRLCRFAGKSYEHYNGRVVEVVDPDYKVEFFIKGRKSFSSTHCLKFTPPIPEGENQKQCDIVNYNNAELVEENLPKVCMCDIMMIMRVGCVCGGR